MARANSNVPAHYDLVRLSKGFVGATGLPSPLQDVTLANASGPVPTDYFDGFLWGINALTGEISKSSDFGETWTSVATTALSGIIRLAPTSDGELLILTGYSLSKTSGWSVNPATATLDEVAAVTAGGFATFLRWGLDASPDRTKFILVEYAGVGDPGWASSRQGLISTDSGSTFVLKYDSFVRYGEALNANTHIHACCYEPQFDRFWISEGHSAVGSVGGLYFSEDDGDTWTQCASLTIPQDGSPTVLVATDYGLVMGTDSQPAGIYILPASVDPTNTDAYLAWRLRNPIAQDGIIGFAERGFKDPETGLVYVCFGLSLAVGPCAIAVSDGRSADLIYEVPDTGDASDRISNVIAVGGKLLANYAKDGGTTLRRLRGRTSKNLRIRNLDTGNILAGISNRESSLAVGQSTTGSTVANTVVGQLSSTSGTCEYSVVVGYDSHADEPNMVIVGPQLDMAGCDNGVFIGKGHSGSGSFQVAIGGNCDVGSAGATAIGTGIDASASSAVGVGFSGTVGVQGVGLGYTFTVGASSVAIGYDVSADIQAVALGASSLAALHGTAVGYDSTSGQFGVAFGKEANAAGSGAFAGSAFGVSALVSANYGTALGYDSTCGHANAVALGDQTTTTAASQVSIGARHIELTEQTEPAAPAENLGRLYLKDNGSGKTQLCIRFATGAVQVLATEP